MHKKHKYHIKNLPNKRELTKVKKTIKKIKKSLLNENKSICRLQTPTRIGLNKELESCAKFTYHCGKPILENYFQVLRLMYMFSFTRINVEWDIFCNFYTVITFALIMVP